MLVEVPQYELRVRVWGFLNGCESIIKRLAAAELEVRNAGDFLQSSSRIEELLTMILFVGNYLNGGTSRGRADGFDLDTLTKLGKLKATQSTLLDFIVTQLERDSPGVLKEIFAPGMEFECVHSARKHRMPDMKEELCGLISQAQGYLDRIDDCEVDSDHALAERRAQVASRLDQLQELWGSFEGWGKRYSTLCTWFLVDVQRPLAVEDFFGIWDSFLTDVKKAIEAYEKQQRAVRALKRSASAPLKSSPANRRASLQCITPPTETISRTSTPEFRRRKTLPALNMQESPQDSPSSMAAAESQKGLLPDDVVKEVVGPDEKSGSGNCQEEQPPATADLHPATADLQKELRQKQLENKAGKLPQTSEADKLDHEAETSAQKPEANLEKQSDGGESNHDQLAAAPDSHTDLPPEKLEHEAEIDKGSSQVADQSAE